MRQHPLPASVRAVIGPTSSLRGRALYDALAAYHEARVDLLAWAYRSAPRAAGNDAPTATAWAAVVGISTARLRAFKAPVEVLRALPLKRTGCPRSAVASPEALRQRANRERAKTATA